MFHRRVAGALERRSGLGRRGRISRASNMKMNGHRPPRAHWPTPSCCRLVPPDVAPSSWLHCVDDAPRSGVTAGSGQPRLGFRCRSCRWFRFGSFPALQIRARPRPLTRFSARSSAANSRFVITLVPRLCPISSNTISGQPGSPPTRIRAAPIWMRRETYHRTDPRMPRERHTASRRCHAASRLA